MLQSKGPFTYDIRKIVGFSDPLPHVTVSFTQLNSTVITISVTPSQCGRGRHMWMAASKVMRIFYRRAWEKELEKNFSDDYKIQMAFIGKYVSYF